ncbi:hypothetical protein LRS14_08820 [Aquincola sp. J276]|nr:hypothetical protein [Aquincola sp. J276]MCR5865334.1 hypothetical protein [Aquincola sp. J276]
MARPARSPGQAAGQHHAAGQAAAQAAQQGFAIDAFAVAQQEGHAQAALRELGAEGGAHQRAVLAAAHGQGGGRQACMLEAQHCHVQRRVGAAFTAAIGRAARMHRLRKCIGQGKEGLRIVGIAAAAERQHQGAAAVQRDGQRRMPAGGGVVLRKADLHGDLQRRHGAHRAPWSAVQSPEMTVKSLLSNDAQAASSCRSTKGRMPPCW